MDKPPEGALGQHGHESMATVEGNGVKPPCSFITAGLTRKGEQRPLHGVAFDHPGSVLAMQACIVTEGCCKGQLC